MKKSFAVLFVIAVLMPTIFFNSYAAPTQIGKLSSTNGVDHGGASSVAPASIASVPVTTAPTDDTMAQGSLTVSGFRFSGDMGSVAESQLQGLVAADKAKLTTLKELHRVADKVERFLQTQHLLLVAKAWVPLQDVKDGIVEIRVLQGTLDSVKTDPKFASTSENYGAVAAGNAVLKRGDAINRDRLEEAVFRVSDHVGAAVRAVLVPTEELGHYDVMFEVDPPANISGSLALDNTGNRYTSAWHETLSLKIRNLTGHSDSLSMQSQILTSNQRSLRLHYQTPLFNGYRIGTVLQATRYRLCCVFEPLDAHGETGLLSLDLNRAWIRSRAFNFSTSAEVLRRTLSNRQLGMITSDHTISQLTLGMKADWNEAGTTNYTYFNLSKGNVTLNASGSDLLSNQNTLRSEGSFNKINYGYSRTQAVGQNGNAIFNLNGQWANKNLDSSETFLLGGMGAIRAYPSGESAGDQSLVAQIEYHHNLNATLRGFTFFDYGRIKVHKNPWSSFTGENDFSLKGLGVGIVWKASPQLEMSLIGAYKVGTNPQANPVTGNDSDGRSDRYRLWAFVSHHF
jgi:hemolysin activation/secretion protein